MAIHEQSLTEALVAVDETGKVSVTYREHVEPTHESPVQTEPEGSDPSGDPQPDTAAKHDAPGSLAVTALPETGNGSTTIPAPWLMLALAIPGFTLSLLVALKMLNSARYHR